MKVVNIDFDNKTFQTDDGVEYPLLFNVDSSITIEEFQILIDESKETLEKLLNN